MIVGDHGNAGRAALSWGPFVLAFDKDRNPGPLQAETLNLPEVVPPLTPKVGRDLAFDVPLIAGESAPRQTAVFIPFADAGTGGGPYAVWLGVPAKATSPRP